MRVPVPVQRHRHRLTFLLTPKEAQQGYTARCLRCQVRVKDALELDFIDCPPTRHAGVEQGS